MKKSFMCLAAATAVFSLMTFTGCEDNKEENTPSIEKQWICEAETPDGFVKQCFDISAEKGLLIGQDASPYIQAGYLPEDADPENSYIAMVMEPYKIKSINAIDETSGTIVYIVPGYDYETMTEIEVEMTLTYTDLTENSVKLTYTDDYGNTFTDLECTVAPEGTRIYTYSDLNMGGE